LLASGAVDVGITYCPAAESQSLASGASVKRVYGFRDHFLLVGPRPNPAQLKKSDDVYTQFNAIVTWGNHGSTTPETKFLSRFDKSATNIKESELFIAIGQVPWALPYSKWYHTYPVFPLQALQAASLLQEYTLTDRGTFLSSPSSVTDAVVIYKAGEDTDPNDPLLNPAHFLLSAKTIDPVLAESFMEWMVLQSGGQEVVRTFEKNAQVLYSPAPLQKVY